MRCPNCNAGPEECDCWKYETEHYPLKDPYAWEQNANSDLAGLAARESAATRVEPMPVVNSHPHVADLVIEDINGRKAFGMKKYGTALQPHNGRDALNDAYQEALDLCKYLRQCIYERDGK